MTPSNLVREEDLMMRRLAVGINTSLMRVDRLHHQLRTLREELHTFLSGRAIIARIHPL
jgi:hypothetical protein